jgi:hypothetical protein
MLPLRVYAQNTNAVVDPAQNTYALTNLTLLLTFATNTFAKGEPVMFQAGLSNMSDSPIRLLGSYYNENVWFYITNANGVRVPPIDEEYFWPGARGGPETVPAHGTERWFHAIPLDEYYLLAPGTYRIFAVRGNEVNSLMYTSQPVTISIMESAPSITTNTPSPPTK